jgi:hypothetical protein
LEVEDGNNVIATSDLSAVAQRAKAEGGSDEAIQSSISPRRCRIVFEISLALLDAQSARQHDDLVMCCWMLLAPTTRDALTIN